MGLRHGAKQLLGEIEQREREILDLLDLAAQRVKYNPDYAIEKIRQAQDAIRDVRHLRDERLPEMLQKAAPPIEARLRELEAWRERVDSGVIRLRKAE